MSFRHFQRWTLAIAVCLAAGCSREPMAPVHGTVTLSDGKPVEGATVTFDNPEKNVSATGTTDSQGVYRLTTREPDDGALLGTYTVTVHQPYAEDSSQGELPRMFPPRYENSRESGLEYTVEDKDNVFDIRLQPR